MDMKLDWQEGLNFIGSNESGHSVVINNDKDENGNKKGFSPIELTAISMGGCAGLDVISILQKKQQDVHGLEIKVHTERVEKHPRVWSEVEITYIVTGKNIDPVAVERAIQLSTENYCAVQNMLKHAVTIKNRFEIIEI